MVTELAAFDLTDGTDRLVLMDLLQDRREDLLVGVVRAYHEATGRWRGIDWCTSSSPEQAIDLEGLSEAKCLEIAEALHDGEEHGESRGFGADVWDRAAEDCGDCESDAAACEEFALECVDCALRGQANAALDLMQQVCNIENAYGDCPTWRPLREACERLVELRDEQREMEEFLGGGE